MEKTLTSRIVGAAIGALLALGVGAGIAVAQEADPATPTEPAEPTEPTERGEKKNCDHERGGDGAAETTNL